MLKQSLIAAHLVLGIVIAGGCQPSSPPTMQAYPPQSPMYQQAPTQPMQQTPTQPMQQAPTQSPQQPTFQQQPSAVPQGPPSGAPLGNGSQMIPPTQTPPSQPPSGGLAQ